MPNRDAYLARTQPCCCYALALVATTRSAQFISQMLLLSLATTPPLHCMGGCHRAGSFCSASPGHISRPIRTSFFVPFLSSSPHGVGGTSGGCGDAIRLLTVLLHSLANTKFPFVSLAIKVCCKERDNLPVSVGCRTPIHSHGFAQYSLHHKEFVL